MSALSKRLSLMAVGAAVVLLSLQAFRADTPLLIDPPAAIEHTIR